MSQRLRAKLRMDLDLNPRRAFGWLVMAVELGRIQVLNVRKKEKKKEMGYQFGSIGRDVMTAYLASKLALIIKAVVCTCTRSGT